ncbi:hypothetical protein PO124_14260 [Bacillus licheniformis]|nr:hypothetical protein [Bacillus licheniformis]
MNQWGALAGMITGAVTVLIWILTGLQEKTGIYEMIPGFFLSLIVVYAVSMITNKPAKRQEICLKKWNRRMRKNILK